MKHTNVKVLERQALTTPEVAATYGIAIGTLQNWRHKRIGPKFHRLGGKKVVYFVADLDEWALR